MTRIPGLALLCALSFYLAPLLAADVNHVALSMVRSLQLGENLTGISFRFATTTPAYQGMARAVGPERAQSAVKDALLKVRPKYQERWDRNLAASYAELLSREELESMAVAGRASPHAEKFFARREEVSRKMQARSTDLLSDLIAEAMKLAVDSLAPRK